MRDKFFDELALLTDFYEFTMSAVYFTHDMFAPATFSLFVRNCPPQRKFFLAAGLERLLSILENFRFTEESLAYLESIGLFKPSFLDYLKTFRFSGEVWALPEGTIFFPHEPVVEITAPIIEAQLIETLVINVLNLETTIASKAIRCVLAAQGKPLVDFAARRTQGLEAAVQVARATYLAGFSATSNTLAGKLYRIPVTGTMAHSFVQSFGEEEEAFWAFVQEFPENSILLLDTYDTLGALPKVIKIARMLERQGKRLKGVRLDSGNLVSLAKEVRKRLDEAGLSYVKIFASGGLEEYAIYQLLAQGAPIDAFGVGTKVGVGADLPYLDAAYKLVSYDGRPVAKFSQGKATLPGSKQVFRVYDDQGKLKEDWIALRGEEMPSGTPLLVQVMKRGRRLSPPEGLDQIRHRVEEGIRRLPSYLLSLEPHGAKYPVYLTSALIELQEKVKQECQNLR